MTETLLQKAQRLGIQPAGRPSTGIIKQRTEEAQKAEIEAQKIASPFGQAKEGVKALGEITGFTPTGRRIAAAIAPYTEKAEDLPNVVDELVGGVSKERRMGDVGNSLKKMGVSENTSEFIDIAIDLPVISLGLSKSIATALEKEVVQKSPELIKFLAKPLTEFAPETLKSILKTDLLELPSEIAEKAGKIPSKVFGKVKKGIQKILEEPLPKPTETALKETKTDIFNRYVEQGRKASISFKEQTPLEVAGQRAGEALDQIQRKLKTIGEQKRIVLNQAATGNKPVGSIALKFRQNLNNYLRTKTLVEGDSKLIRDITIEAERLGANPQAKEVDKFIDFVQDRIYTSGRDLTIPVTDGTTAFLRRITGALNENLKNQLPESYRNLNKQFSDLVGIRDELNVKLGKEGERGGSLMKRVFSPSDANTKKLFEEIKKETGIDLIDEATLARFVMETLGDARQKSLLEELKLPRLSGGGILEFILKMVQKRFNQPEEIIKRARGLTTP